MEDELDGVDFVVEVVEADDDASAAEVDMVAAALNLQILSDFFFSRSVCLFPPKC